MTALYSHKARFFIIRVRVIAELCYKPRGEYSHTLPVQVCAAQRGRDFEAPDHDLERGIHFRGVF